MTRRAVFIPQSIAEVYKKESTTPVVAFMAKRLETLTPYALCFQQIKSRLLEYVLPISSLQEPS
jgi:hypothetical protein